MKTSAFFTFLLLALLPLVSAAQKAVSAWDRIPILLAPEKTATAVAHIRFGTDVLELTGQSMQVQEERKRTYVEVRMPDGTTGWVNKYLLIPEGEGCVIRQTSGVYQNPDESGAMIRNLEFAAGEPVILSRFEGAYAHVTAREKQKEGWVLAENLILGPEEVRVAVPYWQAMREKNVAKRLRLLSQIRSQSTFEGLQIANIVNLAYEDAYAASQNGISEMSTPTLIVAANTPPVEERAVLPAAIENNKELVQIGGATLWKFTENAPVISVGYTDKSNAAFPCYHKTLPKGAKIHLRIPNNEGFVECQVVGKLANYQGIGMTQATLSRIFGTNIPATVALEYFSPSE